MLLPVANNALPEKKKKTRTSRTWHLPTSYGVSNTASRLFFLVFTGIWLQLYELLPSRSSPSSALYIWHLALHPLSLIGWPIALFHPCRVHPLQVYVQIWHTKDPGLRDPVTVFFRPWSCFSPAIPRCACYFFFSRPTADHGRPPFIAPCPDAMMLDPIPVIPYIFRWA